LRVYDVAIASLAIDASIKWTDNVISQHDILAVVSARRGIARRIPYPALLQLALTRELHVALGMSVRDALELAHELLAVPGGVAEVRRGHLHVACDRSALERTLHQRLREVLESAPAPRRGRPPQRGVRG
jgi:hypothetical protein